MKKKLKAALQQLSPKKRLGVVYHFSGLSGKEAAHKIGVNPSTYSQWLHHDQQFNEALKLYSESISDLALIKLESTTLSAVDELRNLAINAKSEQVRLKAIELIISAAGINGSEVAKSKCSRNSLNGLTGTNSANYDFQKLIEAVR